MKEISRFFRTLALALTTAIVLGGCVAGAVFPIPAGSGSAQDHDSDSER